MLSMYRGGDLFIGVYQKGLYTSKDNGETWKPLNYNLPDFRVQAILKTKDAFLVGTDSGVFKFIDRQKGWKPSHVGEQVNSLSAYEDKIIAGTVSGAFLSIDNGEQWEQVGAPGTVHNTAILDGNIIAMYMSGDLFSSKDGGENWNKIDYTPREKPFVYEMAYAGKYLIMSDDYGIHRSSDWGKTWEHVYKTEEIVFSDFLVIGSMIYGGTLR